MSVSPETLMAYADGELEDAKRREVEAAVAADPLLAAELERQRALKSRLGAAFGGVLEEPAPDHLLELIGNAPPLRSAEVIELAAARPAREPRLWAGWAQWAAMAACLVLGFLVAGPFGLGSSSLIRAQGRLLTAQGDLKRALNNQLASDPNAVTAPIRIGLTYRTHEGGYCRTFATNGRHTISGVACREDGHWRVRTAVFSTSAPDRDGTYRTAASQTPQAVMDAVEADIDGAPLDARGEAAAKAAGWRGASTSVR